MIGAHETSWSYLENQPLKIVFIAGPYIGDGTIEAIEKNIRAAEVYAIALADLGVGFFCPHLHTSHFGTKSTADESFFHRLDFQILKRSDALLLTPRWRSSTGATREHDWARSVGMKIFFPSSPQDLEAVVDWHQL